MSRAPDLVTVGQQYRALCVKSEVCCVEWANRIIGQGQDAKAPFCQLRKAPAGFVVFVRPSVCPMYQRASHWADFHEI